MIGSRIALHGAPTQESRDQLGSMASCVSSGSGRWGLSAVRGLSSGRSVRRWVVLVSHPSNEASLSVSCICGILPV